MSPLRGSTRAAAQVLPFEISNPTLWNPLINFEKERLAMNKPKAPKTKQHAAAQPRKGGKKDARWHLAADTQWGSVSMGSADKPTKLSSARSRMTDGLNGGIVRNSRTVSAAPRIEQQEELVMQLVQSSVGFQSTELRFQPARETSFPWLYEIARKYQKWVAIEAEYEFRSNTSVVAPAGSQGRVVLAFNYDSLDPNLTSLQQAETIQPHAAGKPVDTIILDLNPILLSGGNPEGKYCRTGSVPAGGDLKTYDGGILYVCTSGFALDGAPIGEIYVRYRIRLLQPIITGMTVSPTQSSSAYAICDVDSRVMPAVGPYYVLPVDWTSGSTVRWNGIEMVLSGLNIVLPPGKYNLRGTVTVGDSTPAFNRVTGLSVSFLVNGAITDDTKAGKTSLLGAPGSNLLVARLAFTASLTLVVAPGDVITLQATASTAGAPGTLVLLETAGLLIETM